MFTEKLPRSMSFAIVALALLVFLASGCAMRSAQHSAMPSVHSIPAEALQHARRRRATHHVEPVRGAPRRQDLRAGGSS